MSTSVEDTIVTIVNEETEETQEIAVKDIADPVLRQKMIALLTNPVIKAART